MIPLPFSTYNFTNLTPVHFCQTYPNMVGLNMISPMMFVSQQQQTLQSQLYSVMQMKTQFYQNIRNLQSTGMHQNPSIKRAVKSAPSLSIESIPCLAEENILGDESTSAVSKSVEVVEKQPRKRKNKKKIDPELINRQLEEMIYELLNKLGRITQYELDGLRNKYAENSSFLPIFDAIVAKCLPVKKHREDIVRYIIRKTFKFLKADIIKKDKIYGKRAYAILCKKYFQFSSNEFEKLGINTEDEKELIEVLLPYRKNSKNRTMNTNFTAEIFASKEFCEDYNRFLVVFNKVLDEDNERKTEKLVELAEDCMARSCAEKIKRCTRLPWLQVWIEKTRETAFNLPKLGIQEKEEEEDEENKINETNDNEIDEDLRQDLKTTKKVKNSQNSDVSWSPHSIYLDIKAEEYT